MSASYTSAVTSSAQADTAVFAGGCFWGVEAVFRHVRGVSSAVSGYAGGSLANPSYNRVSDGDTGHAEAVQVVFDPAVVSLDKLLEVFFSVAHNPTELNRQGPDVGTQYRSAVFTSNAEQAAAVRAFVDGLTAARTFRDPIVTQLAPLSKFWKAEAYHQDYLASHRTQPYIVYNDLPKLDALKRQFPGLYREGGIASR
ncbi:MAG: peptide-methionine (S)-S-oxide reductase MsrA [Gemmatimonas sp.]